MKVRVVGVLIVLVALLAACSSSSSPSPSSDSAPTSGADVDVQAATACKTMERVLADTEGGKAISGPDAKDMQEDSGALIRTPAGLQPETTDPKPTWYDLGTVQIELYVAISSFDAASIPDLTDQARTMCATIPEAAQSAAKYTPTTA